MKRSTSIKLALFAMAESAVVLIYIGEDILKSSSSAVKYSVGGLVVSIILLSLLIVKDLLKSPED